MNKRLAGDFMDIRLIAIVKNNNAQIVGLRLMDVDADGSIQDVPYQSVFSVLKSKRATIEGVGIQGKRLVGTNGSFERYPQIYNNTLIGKSPLIVISQYERDGAIVGYSVADWQGKCIKMSAESVINYAENNGISNGMLKSINGKTIISSISGSYKQIHIKTSNQIVIDTSVEIDNDPWTVEKFTKYMDDHRYKYTLRNIGQTELDLTDIDSQVEVLKIPIGVMRLTNNLLADTQQSKLHTIVLSNTVAAIAGECAWTAKLKRIIFASGMGERFNDGLNKYESLVSLRFPESLKEINYAFEGNQIETLDLSYTNIRSIVNSFNGCVKLKKLVLPKYMDVIYGSFSDCKELEDVTMPLRLEKFNYGVFNESKIRELDMSNVQGLKVVGSVCLKRCRYLTAIKFPDSVIEIGASTLVECDSLSYLKLPPYIKTIGDGALWNFTGEVEINGETLEKLGHNSFMESSAVILKNGPTTLKRQLDSGPRCIILADETTVISCHAFYSNSRVRKVRLSPYTENIDCYSFSKCDGLSDINLEYLTKLTTIGAYAFSETGIKYLILPEGLRSIGDFCFSGCSDLVSVLLPSTLEKIGRSAFKDMKSNGIMVMFYVYEKSLGLSYCKRNGYRYTIINSLDDYYKLAEESNRTISESKEAKINMLFSSNPIHNVLTTPEYINYADILYNMYQTVDLDISKSGYVAPILNTSKYIDVAISDVPFIATEIDLSTDQSNNEIRPQFITLSNLITKMNKINVECLFVKATDYFKANNFIINFNMTYDDGYCRVLTIKLAKNGDGYEGDSFIIIVLTIGQSIKFVTSVDYDNNTILGWMCHDTLDCAAVTTAPISTVIKNEDILRDRYAQDIRLCGSPVPKYIYNAVKTKLITELMVLDVFDIKKSNRSKGDYVKASAYIMSTYTGNVYECSVLLDRGQLDDGEYIGKNIGWIAVIRFLAMYDLDNMPDKMKNELANKFKTSSSDIFYKQVINKDKLLGGLALREGAYDTEPSYEWSVAQIINELGIDSVKDMNKAMFTGMLNTDFYHKTTKILRTVNSLALGIHSYKIENDEYTVIEGELRHPITSASATGVYSYITAIVPTTFDHNSRYDFYMSSFRSEDVLRILKRLKPTENRHEVLVNNAVNRDDFSIIASAAVTHHSINTGSYYLFEIGIDKSSGNVFLLGRSTMDAVGTCYELLRFKSLIDAFSSLRWFNESGYRLDYKQAIMIKDLANIMDMLLAGSFDNSKASNELCNARNLVLSGVPNGTYAGGSYMDLFEILAKQKPGNTEE